MPPPKKNQFKPETHQKRKTREYISLGKKIGKRYNYSFSQSFAFLLPSIKVTTKYYKITTKYLADFSHLFSIYSNIPLF